MSFVLLNNYLHHLKDTLLKQPTSLGKAQSAQSVKDLRSAYTDLHHRYAQHKQKGVDKSFNQHTNKGFGFNSLQERIAYITARAPATYKIIDSLLSQALPHALEAVPQKAKHDTLSILDIGSGPAVAALAAIRAVENNSGLMKSKLSSVMLLEQDKDFAYATSQALKHIAPTLDVQCQQTDIKTADFPLSDIVIASYVYTEMKPTEAALSYLKSLQATRLLNLVVLPGTKHAFALMLKLRSNAIAQGFQILAPCPHAFDCPMASQTEQSWCHFRLNIERSQEHQTIKAGTLGHEEEPYLYLLVKAPCASMQATTSREGGRIINSPRHRKGHMYLDVCQTDGKLHTHCLTKNKTNDFKSLKKLKWGDFLGAESLMP